MRGALLKALSFQDVSGHVVTTVPSEKQHQKFHSVGWGVQTSLKNKHANSKYNKPGGRGGKKISILNCYNIYLISPVFN